MIFGKILSSRSTTIALPSPITCIKKPPDSLTKFEKQKNYSSRLYKKERKKYFGSLNPRKASDNKNIWKNLQPFFSGKRKISNKITLVDNKENILPFGFRGTQ